MTGLRGSLITASISIAVALLAPGTSAAQNLSDLDTREISHYVLTEAMLAKYSLVVRNLGPLAKNLPGACDDSENAKSLDAMAARIDAVPKLKVTLNSAGLSSREYLLFSLSLFQNGMVVWALEQPGGKLLPGTQPANVKFFQDHAAALKKLGQETKSDECGDDGRTDDSAE
jgi:hypothetical protein